jgi:hypothetical protein
MNEPVAWMVDGVLFNSLGAALNISFDIEQPCIPLYTHPVKELTAQEVMEQTHRNISEAHWKAKTLTDEEITDVFVECMLPYGEFDEHEFARAILKKASE